MTAIFFLAMYGALVLLMVLQKPLFMLVQPVYGPADYASIPEVIGAGFTMDLSMAGYLMAPVALWLIGRQWCNKAFMQKILNAWLWIVAAVLAVVGVVDAALYPHWGFRIDATPVFYFITSPASALASVSVWYILGGLAVIIAFTMLFRAILRLPLQLLQRISGHRVRGTIVAVLMAGLLIIPIRGGVTVSTMAPGRAYFSEDMKLNHAAVNPLFNMMHSLTHIDRLNREFRYMDDAEALAEISPLLSPVQTDSMIVSLSTSRPDIYLIILESFSSHLLPVAGGESIAVSLDSLARDGVYFSNFYAESFRTDRALATILSGLPAMPSTSVLRYTSKFDRLPSLAENLARAGYDTRYFYGGDINFTNLRAYLVATGFRGIVADTDFPVSQRLSKWGVHDGPLFQRVMTDVQHSDTHPVFRVIQTSSSHEPFEVPFSRHENPRINSFMYTDSCLGNFVRALKDNGKWDNALIAIVPDHYGGYPQDLQGAQERHHVPFVLTGGAILGKPMQIDAPASQSAIAPTLLALLGLPASDFPFAHNVLNRNAPHYAWLTEPEWMALVTPDSLVRVNVNTDKPDTPQNRRVKAFVQAVYHNLDKR